MKKLTSRLIQKSFIAALFVFLALPATAQRGTDPGVWNEAMERFARQDRMNSPPIGGIVLTGSSSIARWNDQAEKALAPLTVIPRGFGGSVMNDVLHHLDAVALKYRPRAILIYEGDKPSTLRVDVWKNAQQVNMGYKEIAKQDPLVYYIDSANPFLKADGTVMTDIFVEDGLHLNPMGNLIWGSTIRAALMPQEARFE